MVAIANFQLPIANLKKQPIGNRQLAIGNEKSRAKQRGTSIRLKFSVRPG
jgi:hypothetical protein